MANKIRKNSREPDELNLTIFMALMVCLIPILLASAEFAKVAIIDITLPRGRGSQTQTTQTTQPQEENKLILTVLISDSALTIGAANGFLPSIFYKEFHDYFSRSNGAVLANVEYDPSKLNRETMEYGNMPTNPLSGLPFTKQDRDEIRLIAYETDDNLNFLRPVMAYYSVPLRDAQGRVLRDGNDLIVMENGEPVTELKVGDMRYALSTQFSTFVLALRDEEDTTEVAARRQIRIEDTTHFEMREVSAYDYLKSLLVQIRERYQDVEDRNDLIIAAENQIIYDKIVQIMDVARSANLPNISIAKLRL